MQNYEFLDVYRAARKARRGHGSSPPALKWDIDMVSRCAALEGKLGRGYEFGPYNDFWVHEPKDRLVRAVGFEGVVAQHVLCDCDLYPAIARRVVTDNAAVQVGKGTHFGLDRLSAAMRHYYLSRRASDIAARKAAGLPPRPREEWDYAEGWVLKGDYAGYFYHIQHGRCRELARDSMERMWPSERVERGMRLLDASLDSTEDPGLPIGNQSSQLLAILYLDELDHWMKDGLGMAYGRYMDDFWAISDSKAELRRVLARIEEWSAGVGLSLNDKTKIFPLRNGIDYLGFHTYLTETGKVVRKVRHKSVVNEKRKIRRQRDEVDRGEKDLDAVWQSYMSWCGHVSHGDTYHLRQCMDAYLLGWFPELAPRLDDMDKKKSKARKK